MIELYVGQETARTLNQFKGEKCGVGVKPLLSFSGTQFDSPVANQYTLAKSIFLDFFRGGESQTVDVEGLQLLISFFVGEDRQDGKLAMIHMRCWKIVTKRSGQKLPRVEVEEMGPRVDFAIGRSKEAEAAVWKEAMKRAKGTEVTSRICKFVSRRIFLTCLYTYLGQTKEECRDRHRWRQSGKDTPGEARLRRLADSENEGVKKG